MASPDAPRVPVEYLGRARALRRRLGAVAPLVRDDVRGILRPLMLRNEGGGRLPYITMGEAAAAWRALPQRFGQIGRDAARVSGGFDLTMIEMAASAWSFPEWRSAVERGISIRRILVRVRRGGADLDVRTIASVGLHALARRYQRTRAADDDAVLADLAALAEHASEEDEFRCTVPTGEWIGNLAAAGGRPVLLARTFADHDMHFRAGPRRVPQAAAGVRA